MTTTPPKVNIVATGGSIAGIGPNRLDYVLYPELGGHLTIAQSLDRIPEVANIAQIEAEDLISVGSTAIGPQDWLRLAQRINQLLEGNTAGVVITHGTATLEETAYFLHLTVKSTMPVVVTGAMRPPTAISTDADLNLLDAIRIAAAPHAAGKGVLTVLNNEIQCARDVTKANTLRVETFKPNELGFLGYADSDGKVVFYRTPLRKHTTATPFDVAQRTALPRVDIVYSYAGADGLLVNAVRQHRSQGLVVAGFGGGTFPPAVVEAAA
jgi:L-asparaginase